MSILICGGCGFIGSHLCKYYVDKGEKVICVDNLISANKSNIEIFLSHPLFSFIEADITQPLTHIDTPLKEIYNLACVASPPQYQKRPLHTLDTCYLGVKHTLELAKTHQAKILFSSTSEIYGEPLVSPQTESYRGNVNTLGIRACYDEGKRIGETLMMEYHRLFGVNTRIARIFNTYGPKMSPYDGRVISNFIRQSILGEPATIYGDGRQTRSFCYIDDLVRGLVRLMEVPYHYPINLGNPECFSILELVDNIEKVDGKTLRMTTHPLPMDDPTNRKPDISMARRVLGWKPQVSLQEGLAKTYQYYQDVLFHK